MRSITETELGLLGAGTSYYVMLVIPAVIFVATVVASRRDSEVSRKFSNAIQHFASDTQTLHLAVICTLFTQVVGLTDAMGLYPGAWIRLAHFALLTLLIGRICWRVDLIRTSLDNVLCKVAFSVAAAMALWFARGNASSMLANHFGMDASNMPLALNAGTAIIFFLNWTALLCTVQASLIAVVAGTKLPKFVGPHEHHHSMIRSVYWRCGAEDVRDGLVKYGFLTIAAFAPLASLLSVPPNQVRFLIADQVIKYETVEASWCAGVVDGDRVLFLGPPFDKAQVVRLPTGKDIKLKERYGPGQLPQMMGEIQCNRRQYLNTSPVPVPSKPVAPWPSRLPQS